MLAGMARFSALPLLAAASIAPGQEAAPVAPAAPPGQIGEAKTGPELAAVLAAWEAADRQFATLQIVFERVDRSARWGDQVYRGAVVSKRPDLICLEFKKAILGPDGKPKRQVDAAGKSVLEVEREPFQRIVWAPDRVIQYEWEERSVYAYPRTNQGSLKVFSEVPLRFLFDMKVAEATSRYELKLLPQVRLPEEHLVSIIPRAKGDRDFFHHAFVYLNKQSSLPSKVLLYPAGDKDPQEFRFTTIPPNRPIDDAYFHPPVVVPGWKVHDGTRLFAPFAKPGPWTEGLTTGGVPAASPAVVPSMP